MFKINVLGILLISILTLQPINLICQITSDSNFHREIYQRWIGSSIKMYSDDAILNNFLSSKSFNTGLELSVPMFLFDFVSKDSIIVKNNQMFFQNNQILNYQLKEDSLLIFTQRLINNDEEIDSLETLFWNEIDSLIYTSTDSVFADSLYNNAHFVRPEPIYVDDTLAYRIVSIDKEKLVLSTTIRFNPLEFYFLPERFNDFNGLITTEIQLVNDPRIFAPWTSTAMKFNCVNRLEILGMDNSGNIFGWVKKNPFDGIDGTDSLLIGQNMGEYWKKVSVISHDENKYLLNVALQDNKILLMYEAQTGQYMKDIPVTRHIQYLYKFETEEFVPQQDSILWQKQMNIYMSRKSMKTWDVVGEFGVIATQRYSGPEEVQIVDVRITKDKEKTWVNGVIDLSKYPGAGIFDVRILGKSINLFTQYGRFCSFDDGKHWNEKALSDFSSKLVLGEEFIAEMPKIIDSRGIIISTNNGIFVSLDDGETWTNFSGKLMEGYHPMLKVHDGILYCLSAQDGMNHIPAKLWQIPLDSLFECAAKSKN